VEGGKGVDEKEFKELEIASRGKEGKRREGGKGGRREGGKEEREGDLVFQKTYKAWSTRQYNPWINTYPLFLPRFGIIFQI
jgi:hypothetical protein